MKNLIQIILNYIGWKLIKIRTNQKKPKQFAYAKPDIKDFEAISKSTGVLHLGAHRGSEAAIYNWFNKKVLWIEAIPEIFEHLKMNIQDHYGQRAIRALLGDKNQKKKFFLSNNDMASSSIFELSNGVKEKKLWSRRNIKMKKHIYLEMKTLDSILDEYEIDSTDYNHWVLDLQGSEMICLKGAVKSLKNCKSISIEISKKEFYKGGPLWEEVKDYLISKNFKLSKEPLLDHTDVLFLKE